MPQIRRRRRNIREHRKPKLRKCPCMYEMESCTVTSVQGDTNTLRAVGFLVMVLHEAVLDGEAVASIAVYH